MPAASISSALDRARDQPAHLMRVLVLAAAFVTLTSTLTRGAMVSGAAAPDPLAGGSWRSYANGDRVAQILVDGDDLWVASLGGGVLRWSTATRNHLQYLAPQDGLPLA